MVSIIRFVTEINTRGNGWKSTFCRWCKLAKLHKQVVGRVNWVHQWEKTRRLLRGISWTGNRHYFCFTLHFKEVMAHKVFLWRMVGERKRPETQPTFYWVMDIFSKEPSSGAVLKVTELTLSTNNINGIVDISIPSFVFSFLPVKSLYSFLCLSEEWLRSTCRVSDIVPCKE